MLENPSLTVFASSGLTRGAAIPLGGIATLAADATKIPFLASSNTLIGNQTINRTVSAQGFGGNASGAFSAGFSREKCKMVCNLP